MDSLAVVDGVRVLWRQTDDVEIVFAIIASVVVFAFLTAGFVYLKDCKSGAYALGIFIGMLVFSALLAFMWREALTPIYAIEVSDDTPFNVVYANYTINEQIGDNVYKAKPKEGDIE